MMKMRKNLTIREVTNFLRTVDKNSRIRICRYEYCEIQYGNIFVDERREILTVGEFMEILRHTTRSQQNEDIIVNDGCYDSTIVEIRSEQITVFNSNDIEKINNVDLVAG